MNVFGSDLQTGLDGNARRMRFAFLALFLIGAALRCYASFTTLAIVHPDEHQQFLEQAYRMVHGYGAMFWEQERGLRHPLYPAMLAVPLKILESVGIDDSLLHGAVIRWVVALLALFASAMFAWQFYRRGDAIASLTLMVVFSVMPDMIYWHIHPISETAATSLFLLALSVLDRRPLLAGILLGLSFGVRFQMGFLIGSTTIVAWMVNRYRLDRPYLLLSGGLAISLIGVGLIDRLVFGDWYHSAVGYYRVTIIEDAGNQWGVDPWYQYLYWFVKEGKVAAVALGALALVGARREWKLALLAVSFLVPHSMIAHKEIRFVLPTAPLLLALAATGFDMFCSAVSLRFQLGVFALTAAGLMATASMRVPEICWNNNPYMATGYLFRAAGQQPDLLGIAVMDADITSCGNYFYLRRNVPILAVHQPTVEMLKEAMAVRPATINYLVCAKWHRDEFEDLGLVKVASIDDWMLFRLAKPMSGSE